MKSRAAIISVMVVLMLAAFSLPSEVEAGSGFCHVVRPGDTVASIAAWYHVSEQAIIGANHLYNPNLIYVGQCLIIPTSAPAPAPAPTKGCKTTYVVKRGDFLKLIASRYKVSWQTIAQWNGLANPNYIYPGQRLVIPVKCKSTPQPPSTGPWTARYWPNAYLSGNYVLTNRPASVSFNWGTKGPGGSVPGTYFSARFTRDQTFETGKYLFRIRADDGVRFWLDDILLVDQWNVSSAAEYTVERQLSAGVHHIQIDYYQAWGVALLNFTSEKVNGGATWTCEFYNNTTLTGTPVATHYYGALSFDWGNKAPVDGVTADYFSARCTAQYSFVGGSYQFQDTVDDGVKLYLDDALVIDQWHLTSAVTYTADRDVSAGTHTVKVEYFENNGLAVLKTVWTQH
jgi:LysM repeat protein